MFSLAIQSLFESFVKFETTIIIFLQFFSYDADSVPVGCNRKSYIIPYLATVYTFPLKASFEPQVALVYMKQLALFMQSLRYICACNRSTYITGAKPSEHQKCPLPIINGASLQSRWKKHIDIP